jgi:hypothetical protein
VLLEAANSLFWFATGAGIVAGAGPVGDARFALTTTVFLLGLITGGVAATILLRERALFDAWPVLSHLAETRLERLCAAQRCGRARGGHRMR